MCSVVGYVGPSDSKDVVLDGLTRLEYRGYDSAGFARVGDGGEIGSWKAVGPLSELKRVLAEGQVNGCSGIGHTRWATHGKPSTSNAHPHFGCESSVAVVHNGIIENHHTLRQELVAKGHKIASETDTEIIAHLLEGAIGSDQSRWAKNISDVVCQLSGAFAFLAVVENQKDLIVAVRKGSPLCIGVGDGEVFAASDVLGFAGRTDKVLFLPDESIVIARPEGIQVYDFSGNAIEPKFQKVDLKWSQNEKAGYSHHMLKEIYEQKGAIQETVSFYRSLGSDFWEHVGLDRKLVKDCESIGIVGCGTSWHAAKIGQFFFEDLCKIPARIHLASEFRYMPFFLEKNGIFTAISRSGETADTLEAVRLAKSCGATTLAVTDIASSAIVRETDGCLMTKTGHEIAVASTKAFSTQVTALYWLANMIALEKGLISEEQLDTAAADLLIAAEVQEGVMGEYGASIVDKIAPAYANHDKFIFLGRHVSYPFAMEAALKLKEVSYLFAECYPAGELKHGPIALVDSETPVFVFSHADDFIYRKLLIGAQNVKARDGRLVIFAFEGQTELIELGECVFVLPKVKPLLAPIAMAGLVQLLVYHISSELGRPIDKPRNLAKSVTVE